MNRGPKFESCLYGANPTYKFFSHLLHFSIRLFILKIAIIP